MVCLHARCLQKNQLWLLLCSIVLARTVAYIPYQRTIRIFSNQRRHCYDTILHSTIPSGPNQFQEPPEELSDNNDSVIKEDKTLYEVLGAPATATRAELKMKYVKLAKLSHPDAQISRNSGLESLGTSNIPDFNEIASAWRILGDAKLRKRYDRDLRAKAFAEAAERFASKNLEKAAPAVASMMDNVAVPFLRRTTATTLAVGQALSKNEGSKGGLTDAFKKAVQAGQNAGRFVDSMELSEKSNKLKERANKEISRGMEIQQQLEMVTEQRLLATLQSEDFFLSSEEALDVLNRLAIENTQNLVDRAMLRKTIEQEIESLQISESKYSETLTEYERTDKDWNRLLKSQDQAKINLSEARLQEIEARKALERAQRNVAEAETQVVTSTNALRGIEQQVRKTAYEMEKVTSSLNKRQQKVRNALKKKAQLITGGQMLGDSLSEEELTSLRRKEIQLLGESKDVARMVTRLQSRADKLQSRAEALEAWQRIGKVE